RDAVFSITDLVWFDPVRGAWKSALRSETNAMFDRPWRYRASEYLMHIATGSALKLNRGCAVHPRCMGQGV
ncbi:hypothetical protein, partial [Paraburkholderia tropica]|uniref:hypothetical protein n=1 Tax=Paraburkholderia tropica TaxID=92647 RepID=UPI002AB31993